MRRRDSRIRSRTDSLPRIQRGILLAISRKSFPVGKENALSQVYLSILLRLMSQQLHIRCPRLLAPQLRHLQNDTKKKTKKKKVIGRFERLVVLWSAGLQLLY